MPEPSPASVAVVGRYAEAFNSRDVDAAVELFHPEAEIVPPPTPYYLPPGTTYHGRAGALSLIRAVLARAPHLRLEPREFRTLNDGLLVIFSLLENPSRDGDTRHAAVVFRIVGAQILRLDAYLTEADAHEAARRPAEADLRLGERDWTSSARAAEKPRLTPRQREVFHLLALGLNARDVADRLALSPNTIRTHVRNGVVSLGAKTRLQAAALALTRGEIELRHEARRVEGRQNDGSRRLVRSVQGVTEQRRAEHEIAARLAVSEALTVWGSLDQGGERLLRELALALDFAVGALWLPQGDVLAPRLFWSAPTSETPEFERATSELRLPMGIDLPGRAWERRQPIDLASVIADDGFVRHRAAARDGICGGVALPALTGDEVLAVVELYSRDRAEVSERMIGLLTGIGYELGEFLAHRRGELKPSALTPRELEVLQLAAQGCTGREIAERLVISRATVKTHFEHIYAKLGVSDRTAAVAVALRAGLIK